MDESGLAGVRDDRSAPEVLASVSARGGGKVGSSEMGGARRALGEERMTAEPTLRDRLAAIADVRAGALGQRLVTIAVWTLSVHLILGAHGVWIWAIVNALIQLSERWIAAGVRDPRKTTAAYLAYLLLQAIAWGFLAPVVWWMGGVYGPAAAIAFLAGSFANVMLSSRGSPTVFFLVTTPFAAYLGLMPLIDAARAPHPAQLFIGIVIAALLFNFEMAWRGAQRGFLSEEAANRESEVRRRQAESAVAARTAFIAMVSHELRTPISGVLAAAAELERARPEDVATVAHHAGMVADAGKLMQTLLNDLLDFAKIEAGHMSIEAIPCDLADVVEQASAFYRPVAEQKGLTLTCTLPPEPPSDILSDPTRVRQILNNLLSNAIKFTAHGDVSVELRFLAGEGPTLTAQIVVRDTGAGMGPDRLERLFRAYDQTDAAVARTHGGTGLGLVISRQLARLMGGDISVSSQEGRGSTFSVTLDVDRLDAPLARPESAPVPASLSDLRILVADDHEMNRRVFNILLAPISRELVLVDDGQAALEQLALSAFDVVVLDMNMPGAPGPEVARRLRADAGPNRGAIVLIVTGSGAPADIELCHRSGADAHLLKPVEAQALHTAIAVAFEERLGQTPAPNRIRSA
jgi:signal transduction histidine kinase/ActR/RegA family two-component response regulator